MGREGLGQREQEDVFRCVGADPGSKYDKARELGVPVLDETELVRVIETGETPKGDE